MTPLPKKTINLALQGGGSHGAFTWGVLDRLLDEDDRLTIEGISGTSAGAMNGAALIQGYMSSGAKGAQKALAEFWQYVGNMSVFGIPQRNAWDTLLSNWNIDTSPMAVMADAWQRAFSPAQTNPMNINPLRTLIGGMLDIDAIHRCQMIKLFISATNVETGRVRVFKNKDISVDAVMASACIPFMFQAVQIDGVPYWDGGYVGNPSIFPMIYDCRSPDVVVVQINPLVRPGTPDTATEIVNRLNEITFNASLIAEMRAINFVQDLIEKDHLKNDEASRLKRMNIHLVSAESEILKLGAASKANTEMSFLLMLRDLGRHTTDEWLKKNWDSIGVESSVDLRATFL
jgi:NTE family protein